MEYIGKFGDVNTIIDDIEMLKKDYPQYYNGLNIDELQLYKIIRCSSLLIEKNDSQEKIILMYSSKLIILKSINGKVSKNILQYTDINYIINEGMPNPFCITIYYNSNEKERILYETAANDIINSFLFDLRRFMLAKVEDEKVQDASEIHFYDLEEDKYSGATFAKDGLMNGQSVICSIKQKKIYKRMWLVLRKIVSQTHFTLLCNDEIVIFRETNNSKNQQNIIGKLIYIPLRALKSTSIEATGKGMIMRYVFCSDSEYELFYENEKTDELLKVMSFINGEIAK